MKIISSKVFTPNGWGRVDRLVEKIHIPDNVFELEKKAFKECLHDAEEMGKMIEWREKMKLHRLSDEDFDLILNTRF